MESPEILVFNDQNGPRVPWNDFRHSPAKLLESSESHLWFATENTVSAIPDCRQHLTPDVTILQCASPGMLVELLSATSQLVRAALGFTGVTAIASGKLQSVFQDNIPENSVELLLALMNLKGDWEVCSQAGASFRLRAAIPASSSHSDHSLLSTIRSLDSSNLANDSLTQTEIMAGLLLIHDFLEPSHEYSQSVEGNGADANGDYWHGIMHRREPDFGNSKYWFRRVGDHPCFSRLAEEACEMVKCYNDEELRTTVQSMAGTGWDSFAAVDFFQEAHQPHRKGSAWHQFAEELQMREMLLLLRHCLS